MNKTSHVYIMSNISKMLYVGVTNDIQIRVLQHKMKQVKGFSQRYNLFKLVYAEPFADVRDAIVREKQLKGWLRARKVALINSKNPEWRDFAADWFKNPHPPTTKHMSS